MGLSCPLAVPDAARDACITAACEDCLWASAGQNQSFRHELLSFAEDGFFCVPVNVHKEKEQEEKDTAGTRKNAACST